MGADKEVIKLFAFLYDNQRISEDRDPDHWFRADYYAKILNGVLFKRKPDRMKLLTIAMEGGSL